MYKSYETKRLILKVLDDSFHNAQLVVDYFNKNRAHLKPFDPLRSENFYKVESRKAALEEELKDIEAGKQLRLWIFEKTDTTFENEGSSKKYQKINGAWENHFRLALLNPAVE